MKKSEDYVPATPFRERFLHLQEREGLTLAELAARLEWYEKRREQPVQRPDSTRVARVLGLSKDGQIKGTENKLVEYDNAAKLCRALDLWPVDVGI
jgi:hypothetical protein